MERGGDRCRAGGGAAARQLAVSGLRTLLVDKSAFPRAKVCGGCISGVGRQVLAQVGLGRLVEAPEATALERFELLAGGRRVALALPLGAAISRLEFDAALVGAAVAAGAEFLPETTAHVRGLADSCRLRNVSLQNVSQGPEKTRGQLVLVADGLGRTSLKRHGPFTPQVAAGSRVGLGASVPGEKSELREGTVSMSVDRDGYVGMVRVSQWNDQYRRRHRPEAAAGRRTGGIGAADFAQVRNRRPGLFGVRRMARHGSFDSAKPAWQANVFCFWAMRPVTSNPSRGRG